MKFTRPAKRIRASSTATVPADVHVPASKVPKLVGDLAPSTIANLLIVAAKAYPEVATLIQNETDRLAAIQRAKVIDFDHLSKSAWKTLNVDYARLKGSHAYDTSGEASQNIEACFESIERRCPEYANFETRKSALETLRKIAKSICLSSGIVPHEVKKDYQYGGSLVPVVLKIAKSLTGEEIEKLRPWCSDKLVELQGIATSNGIFEDLASVIELFTEDIRSGDEYSNCAKDDLLEVDDDIHDEKENEGPSMRKRSGTTLLKLEMRLEDVDMISLPKIIPPSAIPSSLRTLCN